MKSITLLLCAETGAVNGPRLDQAICVDTMVRVAWRSHLQSIDQSSTKRAAFPFREHIQQSSSVR